MIAVYAPHPPTANGFAVAGESFVAPVLPEVILQMGLEHAARVVLTARLLGRVNELTASDVWLLFAKPSYE